MQAATLTKRSFIKLYREKLIALCPWAKDEAKLDKFMASVIGTIQGENTWNRDGEAALAAWRELGGKGKITLKALRELPNGTN